MASGYTNIDDGLMWALCESRLNGREFRVLLCIIKKTIGYGKQSDSVSYGQISAMTDIDRRSVVRIVKSLEQKKIIKVSRKNSKICKITILLHSGKSATSGGGKSVHNVVANLPPTNKKTKQPSDGFAFVKQTIEENKKNDEEEDLSWMMEDDFDD